MMLIHDVSHINDVFLIRNVGVYVNCVFIFNDRIWEEDQNAMLQERLIAS